MLKRFFSTLLLLSFLSACASSATPTVVPVQVATPAPETESTEWWREAVFYEIFVRSFYDTDNDGIGDFNGITQKLDYLESLGITAIWLMPIHPSPSYHGYDVINYYAVNTEYGTLADFKNLLDEAHKRNIHVIIDLVINHTSSEHPWFKDANANINSPYRDFYLWANESEIGNWHQGQNSYYYGYFWNGMPDLNYNNAAVTDAMLNITNYWLNDIGIDGFRIDAVKHLIEEDSEVENTPATHEWLKDFYITYKKQNPQAYTIGEVFGAGSSVVNLYTGDELDHIFNFEMSNGFVNSANGEANSGIVSAIKFAQQDMPDFNFATFLTNHDQNRVMSVFNGAIEKGKLASFLMLTSPGTPYIYYGEEIGMQGKKPDEDIRLPMQWNAEEFAGFSTTTPWRNPRSDYTQVNVATQTGDEDSLLEHYRKLITLRKQHPALHGNQLLLVDADNRGVFASLRISENEIILVLVNLTDQPISDYSLTFDENVFAENAQTTVMLFGENQATDLERSGSSSYQPFEILQAHALYIIQFIPK